MIRTDIIIAALIALIIGLSVNPLRSALYTETAAPVTAASEQSTAAAMALIDGDTGELLFCKNENERRAPASTTKICTAITVLEHWSMLDLPVAIPDEAIGVEGSSMNETAHKAGAENTNFANPHGLPNDDHYTTALDLCKISHYAMKNEVFREIVSAKRHTTPYHGHDYKRNFPNKNKILFDYLGGNGIKTGFTKKAGRCLVSSATRDGKTYICTVLNCGNMWEESMRLLDKAFAENNG